MKAGLFIAAALAELVVAQPHHRAHHRHLHEKRDVVTEIDFVTATAPDVVVFVNQFGEPVSTSYVNQWLQHHTPTASSSHPAATHSHKHVPVETTAEPTSTPAPVHPSYSTPAEPIETTTPAPASVEPTTTTPVVAPTTPVVAPTTFTTSTTPAATSVNSGSSTGNTGYGLTYSPYNADGTCKSQAEVDADFAQLGAYGLVRMYGVDCNQLNTVGSAAIAKGMKLFIGIYDIGSVADEVAEIVAYAAGNWNHVDTISIGNELINSAQATVSEVVSAVNTGRALLRAAGYNGPIVTVDTWVAVLNNPELCQVSDYAAINAHAFFCADTIAQDAGSYVAGVAAQVKAKCGKTTIVTESGWPSQGQANSAAVPGVSNQAAAIASLKAAFEPSELILFTAYNDLWKTNFQGSFDAEQYWGIYGTSSQ